MGMGGGFPNSPKQDSKIKWILQKGEGDQKVIKQCRGSDDECPNNPSYNKVTESLHSTPPYDKNSSTVIWKDNME